MASSRPLATFSRLLLRQNQPVRSLTTTARLSVDRNQNTQRDAQDSRHSMNTEANEYSKSGTDATASKNTDAAFEKGNADPEDAKAKAGEGNAVNPLDASPANPELSKGTSETEPGLDKKMSEGGGGRQNGGDSTGDKHGGSSV